MKARLRTKYEKLLSTTNYNITRHAVRLISHNNTPDEFIRSIMWVLYKCRPSPFVRWSIIWKISGHNFKRCPSDLFRTHTMALRKYRVWACAYKYGCALWNSNKGKEVGTSYSITYSLAVIRWNPIKNKYD